MEKQTRTNLNIKVSHSHFIPMKVGNNMSVLNRIKIIRLENNLSLRDLEKLSDVGYSAIRKIENGETIPNQLTIIKLSRGLKLPAHEIFNFEWKNKRL